MGNIKDKIKKQKVVATTIDNSNTPKSKPQPHKFFTMRAIILIVILVFLLPIVAVDQIFKKAGTDNYMQAVKGFLFSKASEVKTQDGRINLLILGKGGKGHEGAELTDSMIFTSVSLKGGPIEMVSIPRDIWIPEIRAKINSAYYWGNIQPERGGGMYFSKQIATEVIGQPVTYALVVDFSGFRDIIDTLGGVDVFVDRSFTDTRYPIEGREDYLCDGDPTLACRYKTIHFDQGVVHMDGSTALDFVRSREGDNEENTDFARSARQQKVISAVGKKILSLGTILNPVKDYKILMVVKNSVQTDIDAKTIGILAKIIYLSRKNLVSTDFPTDLLVNPPSSSLYDKQYVLVPKLGNGKWQDINDWFSLLLN